ncbi:enoyl-CoA hydratase/isomerase family protein [Phaeobacter marinintestinus]|uniref:enoyl-CoA hydratase/isomerase family protein n=1 Tax=Falsiphaeobacter marinintestinus TaxID=1492905 RepID=UPI0011B3FB8D|nr:enoyl-CoA hydratase/isomerase family protein [Phaeobacter marinintestinus]
MGEEFLIRKDHGDGVAGIVLNRAPVNALSPGFLAEFGTMIDELTADDSVGSILISSDFKVLSAGLDLKEAQGFDLAAQKAIVEALNRDFLKLFACPKPVVTAVAGAAIAGGLFFVLGADLRVAGPRAAFGLAEVRVGADLPVGPMEIAMATLDQNTARQLLLTGQPINAEQAHARGIVDVLVPKGEDVLTRAVAEARILGQLPSLAYASIKHNLRGPTIARIEAAMKQGAIGSESGWFNAQTKAAMQRMLG